MQQRHYIDLTERFIHQLERGVRPWVRNWKDNATPCLGRPLRHNGMPYQGVNVLSLWTEAQLRGFASPYWMTFLQAKEYGAAVRKGSRAAFVYKVGQVERERDGETEKFNFLRCYAVFNTEEIEGLPSHFTPLSREVAAEPERIQAADDFVRRTGAHIRHGVNVPVYRHGPDMIEMPVLSSFDNPQGYYATLFHELTHWTGNAARIERPKGRAGTSEYAFEELIAELGAAFLCADLCISDQPRDDHAQYMAHYVAALKENPRILMKACGAAERAVTYLHGLQASVPAVVQRAA